ncbi:PREDICTED: serine carboxypeptidase-like 10 isoform X1 [Camelina sativa]|uniref:Serine carboxypeptidase-like 10 isoform X1 n=1 Tax=Camelina sativa TaxID=90675 RepID=A0ABM1QAF0_CAMSA|nr:PREDICTED: serine carboxypeptidase-like 10 isoform X1 [Camelina sativa]
MSLTLKFLLLLFLSHHVYSGTIVKFLPGFEGPLPFELETGYIGIGEEENIQVFYYFIKSEKNPKEDPLLLWLDGGPGCSSLGGLLFENGPLALKSEVYNGITPSLVSTTYSWTKVAEMANIIYLDQPVGAGFSYSRTPIGKTSDTIEVKRIHDFLQKYYLYFLIECWANDERVREALHVTKGTKGQWNRCNWTIPYDNDIISSVPYHANNSIRGYRSLIYRFEFFFFFLTIGLTFELTLLFNN